MFFLTYSTKLVAQMLIGELVNRFLLGDFCVYLFTYFIHSNLFLLSASYILLLKHVDKLQHSATHAVLFVRVTTINFACLTLVQLFGIKSRSYSA